MDKDALIAFLKDNLSVDISEFYDFYEKGIKVELLLGDEVISESSVTTETSYDI